MILAFWGGSGWLQKVSGPGLLQKRYIICVKHIKRRWQNYCALLGRPDITLYVLSAKFKLLMRSIELLQSTGRWTGMYRDEFTRVVTGVDIARLKMFQTIVAKAEALHYNYARPAQLAGFTDDTVLRRTAKFTAAVVRPQSAFDVNDAERVRQVGVAPPLPKLLP